MNKLPLLALLMLVPGGTDPGTVVHEWGTFTSIAGDAGEPQRWRPLSGPTDLPKFVYDPLRNLRELAGKGESWTTVRMETPVLYFYTDRERDLAVKVGFPQGQITEWYPKAKVTRTGVDWGTVRLLPNANVKLPHDGKPSHYYPAREVDAAVVKVGTEHEKLLFYRGVGSFPLPLKARLHTDDEVVLQAEGAPVRGVFLFENRGGRMGWRFLDRLDDKARLPRPSLDGSLAGIRAELERELVGQGLFAKEAAAMLETWKDTWFEEGLRVFYLVPRAATDRILPLEIKPAPRACVRVLVGRMEIPTPSFLARVEEVVERLDSPRPAERQAAFAEITALGRYAQPALLRLAPSIRTKEQQKQLFNLLYR